MLASLRDLWFSKQPGATPESSVKDVEMKIGELAAIANCTPDTIRFYEKEGLLPPAERTGSNYRKYGHAHIERLRLIRNCRELDMTHEEVRVLLRAMDTRAADCCTVNALVDSHIGHVDARIEELSKLKEKLTALRSKCQGEQPVESCAIVRELSTKRASSPGTRKTHLG
jgi:Cd(II)/Pb(II)-responsive transcriptional regulator